MKATVTYKIEGEMFSQEIMVTYSASEDVKLRAAKAIYDKHGSVSYSLKSIIKA